MALNITLTAINSVIALFTLPLITGLAIAYYDTGDEVSLPFGEVVNVFAIVLVPVAVYSLFMLAFAVLWGTLLTRRTRPVGCPAGKPS